MAHAPDIEEVATTVERRRSPRAPARVRIHYGTVDALFSEFTRNVNEGGLFVETENLLDLDEVVVLQFSLPESDAPVQVRGRVVRLEPATAESKGGMGIEFEKLDGQARDAINALVRDLRTNGASNE